MALGMTTGAPLLVAAVATTVMGVLPVSATRHTRSSPPLTCWPTAMLCAGCPRAQTLLWVGWSLVATMGVTMAW